MVRAALLICIPNVKEKNPQLVVIVAACIFLFLYLPIAVSGAISISNFKHFFCSYARNEILVIDFQP